MKIRKLALEEMETSLLMNATDRGTWDVYSDDPVMIKKLIKAGAEEVPDASSPTRGRFFRLDSTQVLIRRKKPTLSDEERTKLRERLAASKKPQPVGGSGGQTGHPSANLALNPDVLPEWARE